MSKRFHALISWAIPVMAIGGLISAAAMNWGSLASFLQQVTIASPIQSLPPVVPPPEPGPRLQLTYQEWVALLDQEARAMTDRAPENLNILVGDSLSLWFPSDLLPNTVTWLNQGISGETSTRLLRRLELFDATRPQIIFLMIGINDLIQGETPETILANTQMIVRDLKSVHPKAKIVVQSVLPHGNKAVIEQKKAFREAGALWAEVLSNLPNEEIRRINQQLEAIAREEGVDYLDLHSLFTNDQGDLRADLTTDGLHLNREGYQIWRSQLQRFQARITPSRDSATPSAKSPN